VLAGRLAVRARVEEDELRRGADAGDFACPERSVGKQQAFLRVGDRARTEIVEARQRGIGDGGSNSTAACLLAPEYVGCVAPIAENPNELREMSGAVRKSVAAGNEQKPVAFGAGRSSSAREEAQAIRQCKIAGRGSQRRAALGAVARQCRFGALRQTPAGPPAPV